MRFIYILMLIFSCSSWSYTVGHQTLLIDTGDSKRQLSTRVFYPSLSDAPSLLQASNSVFQGFSAIPDAPLAAGKFPLVILSHGSGGNNTSLAWLATQLARHGIIAVAASHPGSTTGDSYATTDITLQTRDISSMLNFIMRDFRWGKVIDHQKIGVIGHSKGGYSTLALTGVQISRQRFADYCATMPTMPDCQFYHRAGVRLQLLNASRFEASYRDARIKFAVALDPGMAYAVTPQSVASIKVPVLLLAADYYIRAPKLLRLGVENIHLPQLRLPQTGHFDFLPLCQPQAAEILAAEGEEFICATPEAERAAIHQQVVRQIMVFLRQNRVVAK